MILGLTFFLFAAVGIGIDGSHLYAQRQMAQAAADAAAQAGIMSLYAGTDTTGSTHYFSTTTGVHTCAASDNGTPCYYAQTLNGFNVSATDTVTYEPNPSGLGIPSLSSTAPVNLLRVTVSRSVSTFLMRLLGPTATTVSTSGTAAIVNTISPVPMVITHPTMASALDMNGTTSITICGGPQQSIQVNSNSSSAFNPPSSGNVDLSKAGPADTSGNCTAGTGADFGVWGGPSSSSAVLLGSTGNYYGNNPPIPDPLSGVAAPSTSGLSARSGSYLCTNTPGGGHCGDCPASQFSGTAPATCQEYVPGIYSSLNVSGVSSAIFDPGVYIIQGGGFSIKNSTVQMCQSCTADTNTVNGMVIYDTGSSSHPTATGGFTIDTNAYATLWGGGVSSSSLTSAPSSPYYGILFFEDHAADAQTHTLGAGNGCFSVVGTVYITNTLSTMQTTPTHFQQVVYHGTPCSSTQNVGEIIVSALQVKGTSGLNMRLLPTGYIKLNKVALVQ